MTFSREFFSGNRRRLIDALPGSLIVIAGHEAVQESADLSYPFRQDSSFWYLSGLSEPGLVLLIDASDGKSCLLLPERNSYKEEWDGEFSHTVMEKTSGIRDFLPRSELTALLKKHKKAGQTIHYLAPLPEVVEPYGFYSNPARRLLADEIGKIEAEPVDIRMELARLRQVKQPPELDAIKRAIKVTGSVLADVRARLSEFKSEKDLERAISAGFFSHGSDGHGYEPIVASGKNAATIHYHGSESPITRDKLLLLDVGAKVEGYSADISRTWSVGKISPRQQAVYEAVIRMQDEAFSMLKPGVIIKEYQQDMEKYAAEVLKKLGVKPKSYPHGFSHFLGLDVHDAGDYWSPLTVGSVLTVEPGLYLPEDSIGVRVEDNVLITEDGFENLSGNIPRDL